MTPAAGQPETPGRLWAWEGLALALLAGCLAAIHLGHPALVDPDEPRTALVMRLMAERGDWLAPHLPRLFHHDYPHDPVEGDLFAYCDKPPLGFCLGAAAMKVLGPTALAARLPSALAYLATVLLVYAGGRLLWPGRAGFFAAVVMALSPLAFIFAHIARMDALLVALMTAMLLAILRLVHGAGPAWAWTLVLYVAAGLGLLTKGPEAIALPAAAVLITVALTGRWRDLRRLRPLTGAVICLAIAMPWYLYMHLRYPGDGQAHGFLYEFLVRQHVGRATSGEFGHRLPPGALLGILLVGMFPWSGLLPWPWSRLLRQGWQQRRQSPAVVLLLAWPAIIVAAFSLSRTQLPHYVLPAVPPLALLAGAYAAERLRAPDAGRWFRWSAAASAILMTLGLPAMTVALCLSCMTSLAYWAAVGLGATAAAAAAAFLVWNRPRINLAVLAAATALVLSVVLLADPLHVYRESTTIDEAATLAESERPGDAVIAYPYTPYSLAWYLWPREIPYPMAGGPEPEEPSFTGLLDALNQPRRTFCVLQKRSALEAIRAGVRWPIRVLSSMPDHTLLVTEPPPGGPTP
jgi:4-amino-4-deoxy-L-arabinose transferase-like glycosyltransferase